jgi:hypothetical protein
MPRNDFEMTDSVSSNGRTASPLNGEPAARRRSVALASNDHRPHSSVLPVAARIADRGFLKRSIFIGSLIASW